MGRRKCNQHLLHHLAAARSDGPIVVLVQASKISFQNKFSNWADVFQYPNFINTRPLGAIFMRTLKVILSILVTSSLVGQTKAISVPTNINYNDQADTSLWYASILELAKQINVENLQLSTDSFHFQIMDR